MIKDTEYYFRQTNPVTFEVAKFTNGRSRPDEVYKATQGPKRWHCSCPAGAKGQCKHIVMLEGWIEAGKPVPEAFQLPKILKKVKVKQPPPKKRSGSLEQRMNSKAVLIRKKRSMQKKRKDAKDGVRTDSLGLDPGEYDSLPPELEVKDPNGTQMLTKNQYRMPALLMTANWRGRRS